MRRGCILRVETANRMVLYRSSAPAQRRSAQQCAGQGNACQPPAEAGRVFISARHVCS